MSLIDLRVKLNKQLSQHVLAVQQMADEAKELSVIKETLLDLTEAQSIVQSLAKEIQQRAHESIASVVTHCLKSVFGNGAYEFRLVFEEKRGRTECRPVFIRDGNEVNPIKGSGGGTVDVCSFALRMVCLVLSRPPHRRLLVLDEPFRFLSTEYRPAVCALIDEMVEQMGMQFVIVTHSEEFKTGKVIEL